jgi:threonine dehydrogenase-like Zn-dependent dehydrogenase
LRSTRCPSVSRSGERAGAETLDFAKEDIYERIQELTDRRGADACIDAVGTEAEPTASIDSMVDRVKVATDRPHVLRQAIHCCRNFGTVSIVGVYGGYPDKIPMGSAINRGLTFKMAQTPVQHYLPTLLERIEKGEIDRSLVRHHGTILILNGSTRRSLVSASRVIARAPFEIERRR